MPSMKKVEPSCLANCQGHGKCIFQGLDSSTKEDIEKNAVFNTYKKSQLIFRQGNPANGLYCVHSGRIKIVISNRDGKDTIVRLAGAGDLIGHRAIFSSENYHASAVSLENSVVAFLPKDYVLNLMNKHPNISLLILKQLSKHIGVSDLLNACLVHKNVRERLATLLLELKKSYGIAEGEYTRLEIKLTREEMASMIGTTLETLVRLITEFKNEEIIGQDGKILIIINEKKLIEFANV
jgi:CRP-like cAMP-binding protein